MKYIDSTEKLTRTLKELSPFKQLAVDTEADSLHRYFEKLCLIQVSTPREDYVIDPLAISDLRELMSFLERKSLILHGGDFDLRILWRFYQFRPQRIFDSLIAAQILGLKSQSLASLVEKYFGVHLSKTNQKADWSRRPLTPSMIEYAGKDVHFLHPLALQLEKELKALERFEWFEESCRDLIEATKVTREVDPSRRWRIKGSHALNERELIFLKEVWEWRETEARHRDRPSFKVMNGDVMIAIAKWRVNHPEQPLQQMPNLPRRMEGVTLKNLDQRLEKAWNLPLESIVEPRVKKQFKRRLLEGDRKKLIALKEARQKIAQSLKCDPGILVSNASFETILRHSPKDALALNSLKCLKNWQFKLLAPPILEILNRDSS